MTTGPSLAKVTSPSELLPLGDVIAALSLNAKKSLSQNFILDLNLTQRIARSGGPLQGRTVVEIGPGPGGLTRGLLMQGAERVIAIEKDERCQPALEQIGDAWPGRLETHFGDALSIDIPELLGTNAGPVTIAANLPYAIATKLLTGWLETNPWPPWFDTMVLMFQQEVAERITADANTKAYGRLAVLAGWRTQSDIVLRLRPDAFVPPPKVSSAVVLLKPKQPDGPSISAARLSAVTAAAFGQRRKMLRQSLRSLTPMAELLCKKADVAPTARAETLSVADFVRLTSAWETALNSSD